MAQVLRKEDGRNEALKQNDSPADAANNDVPQSQLVSGQPCAGAPRPVVRSESTSPIFWPAASRMARWAFHFGVMK
jgi:hypothetical protein